MAATILLNMGYALRILTARVGNPYVYGGTWSATNVRQGCDCSALAAHLLNAVIYGPAMTWQRTDGGRWITTEAWRPVQYDGIGPFGTVTVRRPQDIPRDALVKLAIHHGPGGGANSHMWVEINGVTAESAGGKGLVVGGHARAITDPWANDWAYLPRPAGLGRSVVVRDGDTLTRIAARHGTTVDALKHANTDSLPDVNRIFVGQVLNLP